MTDFVGHSRKGQVRRVLPPIEGVPKDPPTCPWCGRKLKPWATNTYENIPYPQGGFHQEITRRVFSHWLGYDGLWDRLVCARDFATAAHAAGFRRKR